MRLAVLAGCVLLLAASSGRQARTKVVPYGKRVHYEKGKTLHFADLDLVYVGPRHEASDVFPNGFDYQDFDVTQGEHTIQVSWTSGTGDLGPTFFKRNGHEYALELKISQWQEPLNWFGPDELILWKDPKY